MFEDENDMLNSTAGTPAFLAPECCQSGKFKPKPADIWAMGVTIYVLLFGCVPFYGPGVMGIYRAILNHPLKVPENTNPQLADFLQQILQKDPNKRFTIEQCKEHPWITKNGQSPLEPVVNTQKIDVTHEEIMSSISTGRVMKCIDQFVIMTKVRGKLVRNLKQARERLGTKIGTSKENPI